MKYIAVHVDEKYENSYSKKWIEYINNTNGYNAKAVNLKATDFISQIEDCAGVMWHYRHTPQDKQIASKIFPVIEDVMKIPVWPNYKTRWHFDEKVAQYFLMRAMKVPFIKSWVFWDYDEASNFLETTDEYPLVFKLSVGAGSANIFKISSVEEGKKYLKAMFGKGIFPYTDNEFRQIGMDGMPNISSLKHRILDAARYIKNNEIPLLPPYYQLQKNYIYLQKFMPNNSYDIRITIIGDRAFGFIRYNRPSDFRASGSGILDTDKKNIPMEAVKIAHQFSEKAQFQSMAYDFLLDENNQPIINEISYGYKNKAVYSCPGYWDRNLVWHEGNIWPEKAHVEDFIASIERNKV